ncbi:MAG: hypothetical protein IT469_01800 [Pseudomonadales bacterium]|nr:hypothetical protein [Pseudomonadales bacterium]
MNWKDKTAEERADDLIRELKYSESMVITADGDLQVTADGRRLIADAIREAMEAGARGE